MPKLKCFSIDGVELWFWSIDHHPPHFHAKRRGEWEVKVNFLRGHDEMIELIWATKKAHLSKADREIFWELVEKHRLELLKEWEEKVQRS
ncbi:MAG: DUF4160 domain-containing protein [Limisphaerales bacterium]